MEPAYTPIGYSYDNIGRMNKFEYPIDGINTFEREWVYDKLGRIESIQEYGAGTPYVEYDFNKTSQMIRADYDTGAFTTWTYDDVYGHLNKITHNEPSGTPVASYEYDNSSWNPTGYDKDGLKRKVVRENGNEIFYTYDSLNRLTDEHCMRPSIDTEWRRQYTYDDIGNRTQLIETDDQSNSETYHYIHNAYGQLIQV